MPSELSIAETLPSPLRGDPLACPALHLMCVQPRLGSPPLEDVLRSLVRGGRVAPRPDGRRNAPRLRPSHQPLGPPVAQPPAAAAPAAIAQPAASAFALAATAALTHASAAVSVRLSQPPLELPNLHAHE